MRQFADKRVTVLGLGRFGGGVGVARWLVEQGASVTVTDQQDADALAESVAQLDGLGVAFKLGGHDPADFAETDLVVANPAVPPNSEMLEVARKARVPVTTEIALLVERLPTRLVFGVTGTKGKSTTAALLARMLGAWSPLPPDRADRVRAARSGLVDLADSRPRRVWAGGNMGGSLLGRLPEMSERDFVVLELSSFMLHHLGRIRWSPHVALVTMVDVDHVAWHGGEEAYLEAKRNLVRHQAETDFAVLPAFSKPARAFRDHTAARVVEYGKRAHLPEAFAPLLPGKHNRLNERGAFAAASLVGVYPEQAAEACADFAGLPHRLQLVHEADGVRWVNDSIATIPAAAAAACEAFAAGTVVQIVGGSDKGIDPLAMCRTLADRCRAVLCVGDTGPRLAGLVGERATVAGTLAEAVETARRVARDGDVVLLSPGYASYDQWANFEARGEAFASLAVGGDRKDAKAQRETQRSE